MESIKDYQHYNSEMEKALADKLFFLDYIGDCEHFADFGCADGALLQVIREKMPKAKLYGMDMDAEMLQKAADRIPEAVFVQCTLPQMIDGMDTKTAGINFSSVFHEVYSYCTPEQIAQFWQAIRNADYQYIIIRDMICNVEASEQSDADDVAKVREKKEYEERLKQFEEVWGSIECKRNLIHFLLKYRYLYNWSREVRENYIPLTGEKLLQNLDIDRYEIVMREEFTLPFIKANVKETFDIDLKDATHVKLILKRRSES